MRSSLRCASIALLLSALLTACGGGVTEPPPATTPILSSASELTAGQSATLTGARLAGATTVSIDGVAVPVSSATEGSVTFTAPTMRACETDGRAAQVIVTTSTGTATITAKVATPATPGPALRVGESMALTGAVACLQLPRDATARYALTWVNFTRAERIDTLFTLTAAGGTTATSAATLVPASSQASRPAVNDGAFVAQSIARWVAASRALTPSVRAATAAWAGVDPATAVVGDTVQITDWFGNGTGTTGGLVPMKVAAIVDYVVFLVDPRVADAAAIAADTDRLTTIGTQVVSTLVPSLKAVFGSDAQVILPGMGGRVFVVATNMPLVGGGSIVGAPYGASYFPTSTEPRAWHANVIALAPNTVKSSPTGLVTSFIAHENTHVMDGTGYLTESKSNGSAKSSWFLEALASATEEMAARMVMGTATGATLSSLSATTPVPEWKRMGGWIAASPTTSLLSTASAMSFGAYSQGSQLVLFARERLAQADYTTPTTTAATVWGLLKARYGTSPYDNVARTVDDIAAVLNMTGDQMLEQWALAVTLDDLVPATVAAQEGLPQFASWNNTPTDAATFASATLGLSRATTRTSIERLGGGSYNARYIDANANYGISFSVVPKTGATYSLRLTRVR